jgi:glycine betaine/proline transport system ATP-binding protein
LYGISLGASNQLTLIAAAEMDNSPAKINIKNLIKIYGEKPLGALKTFSAGGTRDHILKTTGNLLAIADVSFTVNRGELFVIMGLSGSGKSTLVRCLNRLLPPTSGHVYIDDEDITNVNEQRLREIRLKKISMVFQHFGLFPHKTVVENVEYGLKMQTLELVGLVSWADYLPATLSGGMQQRVGLARALATGAEILLLDEPFSALDPLIRRGIQDELLHLQKKLHKTIIFVSHDIQEALKMGDRIAVMKDGHIVQIGTPEELITQPADDYIRAFVQDVNRAQVLKTGAIARPTISVTLDQDSAQTALARMENYHLEQLYVLDQHGKPVGVVRHKLLRVALQQGHEDITQIMCVDFPQVPAGASLESIFHLYQAGLPVVVVDAAGKFSGVLEPSDVLANIGSTHH